MYHIDHDWISKRVNGHGACYSYNSSNGLAFISWIYGVGRLRVFWYNIQLFFFSIHEKTVCRERRYRGKIKEMRYRSGERKSTSFYIA